MIKSIAEQVALHEGDYVAAVEELERSRTDLLNACKQVQQSLAAHRDGEPIMFEGREICLEELKYLVVDPVLDQS